MRLERLDIALRRRSPWEAVDLGLVMLRNWRGPVFRAWFATLLPIALLLSLALWQWPGIAMLVVWWLKPLFDRVLLKVFAETAFGAPPPVREVWRSMPGLLRRSGLLAGLTWRRFNLRRSFELPVWQLEGQGGKAGRERLRILGRKTGGHAFWLALVCVHFLVIFEIGFILLVEFARPTGSPDVFTWRQFIGGEQELWQTILYNGAWLAAESIVEPFFVAAGFCLYLNRRSELEGWDIEVAFRRMAERQALAAPAGMPPRRATAIGLLALALGAAWLAPGDAAAEVNTCPAPTTPASDADDARGDEAADADAQDAAGDEDAETPPLDQATADSANDPATGSATTPANIPPGKRPPGVVGRAIGEVLADPVFGHPVDDWRWQYRSRDAEKPGPTPWWAKKLAELAEALAVGMRGLIYLLVLIAAAALLVVLYRYRHRVFGERAPAAAQPTTLFGLDLSPASLPADIAASALAEVEAGRPALALSLLYRGTLLALMRRGQIEFRAGDTEDSCLARVRGRIEADAATYFAQLLDAWKRTAYAGQPPAQASARELCMRWARFFSLNAERA